MIDQLNIWVVLYTCGFAMGIFLTVLFILFRKKYSNHVLNIAFALLMMSSLLFSEIAEESNLVDRYPFLLNISTILDLLIWPFLLFYIQYIVGKRSRYGWIDLLYFVPFVLAFLWQIPFMRLPDEAKLTYFSGGIPSDVALLVGFKMAISLAFLSYYLILLRAEIARLEDIFPKNKKARFLLGVRRFSMAMMIIIAIIYLLFFNEYFQVFPIGDSDRIGSLIISGVFYYFGILVFKNPHLLEEDNYSEQVKLFFAGRESGYLTELVKLFEERKIHLNEKLVVKHVAEEMNLTNQQLSYLINKQLGLTFLDLVNTFRIREVQEKMKNEEIKQKTLLGLALESGFNSKASFNRIFKDHTGSSPSTFLKTLKK